VVEARNQLRWGVDGPPARGGGAPRPVRDGYAYGGYTTNLAIEDLTDGKAWVVTEHEGEPLPREHGGQARLLVPHLYFWKSAKWVQGLRVMDHDEPGFWESNGYHHRGDPWQEQRYWTD
jgi:DMSO/TMAO reductase YedYZ molybdopterin-dependent catalytic subunit